jgi:hypothetical protein
VIGGGILTALGVGVGVTGTVVAGEASADYDTYDAEIGDRSCWNPTGALAVACQNLGRAANKHATATNVAVAGYVSAGVGATFLVLGLTVWNRDRVRVASLPIPGGAGLSVSGTF